MDMYIRFNRKNIDDRIIDTLIGISKGLTADGIINQQESEFLYNWLLQNRQNSDNPIIINLLEKIESVLNDGTLDQDESKELLSILQKLSGHPSEFGEIGKATTLPVDDPMPPITFENKLFLFSGTFAYGTRRECHSVIENLGGSNLVRVNSKLNYLVIGSYVTDSWAHETFGRKISLAMEYKNNGVPITIITEEHWVNEAGL